MNRSSHQSKHTLSFCVLCVAVVAGGCTRWQQEKPKHRIELSTGTPAIDSVQLDVAVVKMEAASLDIENSLWDELDQQQIDLKVRRQLAANGIRCGVANASLPVALRDLIDLHDERRASEETGTDSLIGEETTQQRLQVRSGQPTHVIVSQTMPTLSWVVNDDGYLYGRESRQARCQLTVKARPVGDRQVRIELLPEITHGNPQQRIGVGNNALVYEVSQDRHSLDPLKLITDLEVGQWLVLGNTATPSGIGDTFLRDTAANGGLRKLLLIGIASSQSDGALQLDDASAPIATPTD